jgi:hypothetical protein
MNTEDRAILNNSAFKKGGDRLLAELSSKLASSFMLSVNFNVIEKSP